MGWGGVGRTHEVKAVDVGGDGGLDRGLDVGLRLREDAAQLGDVGRADRRVELDAHRLHLLVQRRVLLAAERAAGAEREAAHAVIDGGGLGAELGGEGLDGREAGRRSAAPEPA